MNSEEIITVTHTYICGRCGIREEFSARVKHWPGDNLRTMMTVSRNNIRIQVANTTWAGWSSIQMMCPACHKFMKTSERSECTQ